jgi:hypothetical protein
MIEAIVLNILERVVGSYLSGVVLRKQELKTRAEVIAVVKNELAPVVTVGQQLDALTIAVRELDKIVTHDPYLRWDDERLVPVERRSLMRSVSPADALEELADAVKARRVALRLPAEASDVAPRPSGGAGGVRPVAAPAGHPETPHGEEGSRPPEAEAESPFVPFVPADSRAGLEQDGPWVERVLGLRKEVADERRRRDR